MLLTNEIKYSYSKSKKKIFNDKSTSLHIQKLKENTINKNKYLNHKIKHIQPIRHQQRALNNFFKFVF